MDYEKRVGKIVKQEPKKIFKEFLICLKELFNDYLKGNVTDLLVSNLTVNWYAVNDNFSDELIKIEPRIKDLSVGMDITHPDFSKERKRKIVKELNQIVEEILKKNE